RSRTFRSASFLITLLGTAVNTALTFQVTYTSKSFKWEPDTEWESTGHEWRPNGLKIMWALLSTYFAFGAIVCAIGLLGVVKNKPSLLRFFRDYSIGDIIFCGAVTIFATYASFHTSARVSICEEFSRQPELLNDMIETGLSLENCERWFDTAVLAGFAFMVVVLVVRIHFLLAVTHYYSHLTRYQHLSVPLTTLSSNVSSSSLPSRSSISSAPRNSMSSHTPSSPNHELQRILLLPDAQPAEPVVYAPIPMSSLTPQLKAKAREAWVSRGHRYYRTHS
ncbi:hypothetical protein FISHEDRAFT_22496, partial [Fistulina hepatica ATCC 64428]